MNTNSRLMRLAGRSRLTLGLTALTAVLGGGLVLVQAYLLAHIIDKVFLHGSEISQITSQMNLLAVVIIARAVMAWGNEVSAAATSVRIKTSLRQLLVEKVFRLGPGFITGQPLGELSNTLTQGVEALESYFSQYLSQLILAAVLPVIILGVVFPLDTLSGVVLLVTAPLIPLFMVLIGKASQVVTRQQYQSMSRLSAYFLDSLKGLTTLKRLGQAEARAARIGEVSEQYRQVTMKVLQVTFLSALALELLATISTAVLAVEIGVRLIYARMEFFPALFILVIAPEYYLVLRNLGLRFHAAMAGQAAAKSIFEVLDKPEPILIEPAVVTLSDLAIDLKKSPIEFNAVSFRYPKRDTDAVSQLTFRLEPGTLTVLVGPSGAGKSTIAQLLLRFIQPQSGFITIGGQALEAIPLEVWRTRTAWVSQQPYLFHMSIRENLRLGQSNAGDSTLRQALEWAELWEWILTLPNGIDTVVGEEGGRLSGGQAQRLALARAYLHNAPLLILDEPTAHLDPELEDKLSAVTRQLCKDKTVLMIAHRLSSIMRADQILVIENGQVTAGGTHSDLLRRNDAYRSLVAAYLGVEK
jgi:ATP-binding cassette subfamily C protein CydD